jgi:hypothetical protein
MVNGNLNFNQQEKQMPNPQSEQLKQEVPKPKTEIIMSIALAQEIINYLQTRPYAEVFQLIGKIMEAAK